ncbi:MAG: hypothetical protein PVI33_03270 [Candidatus Omnitrophota bacterium]|jgi:hypothetical protein
MPNLRLVFIISLLLLSGCVTEYYVEESPFYGRQPSNINYSGRYDTGVLEIGLTEKQINEKWGFPSQIVRAISKSESIEEWEYCDSYSASTGTCESYKYLYFKNGRLSGWKE